jgi:hypothetical protein
VSVIGIYVCAAIALVCAGAVVGILALAALGNHRDDQGSSADSGAPIRLAWPSIRWAATPSLGMRSSSSAVN